MDLEERIKQGFDIWMAKVGVGLEEALVELEGFCSDNPLALVKKIEKTARGEFSIGPEKFFSDVNVAQRLINIGYLYKSDEAVLENIVSTLWRISERCGLRTQGIYDFLIDHINSENKKIKRFVMYSIPFFPQFDQYDNKWEYILSMPMITPINSSMMTFYFSVNMRASDVPNDIKDEIICILENYMTKHNIKETDSFSYQRYVDLITKLKIFKEEEIMT